MAFTEDLGAFFSLKDFAVSATFDGRSVQVIFDRAYLEANGIASTGPQALGRTSDFPANAVGKTLGIASTTYTITNREVQDDGVVVLLRLRV